MKRHLLILGTALCFSAVAFAVDRPSNPSFYYFTPCNSYQGYGEACFKLPTESVEGVDLDPESMYYNVFHDGSIFTYMPGGKYAMVREEMTDVPYTYSDGMDFNVHPSYLMHQLKFYEDDFSKFGVQLCHKDGDTVTKSDIIYSDGSSVAWEEEGDKEPLPGSETIISEQPEGTLYENLYRSSESCSAWGSTQNDGKLGKMVIDDNGNFYIYSPIDGVDAWIKGEQTDDGTVVVKLPQAVSSYAYDDVEYVYYIWSMKLEGGLYVPDTDNPDITFTWSDNTLTMTGTNVLGYGASDGMYQMGEGSLILKKLPYAPLTEIPAGAKTSEWKMNYDGQVAGNSSSMIVTVATDGSDIYVKGLGGLPETWVKGTFDGTTAVFASDQYLGVDKDKKGHSYFTGGRKEVTTDPIGGYDITRFYRTKDVKFTFDAASNTFRTDSVVLVGVGLKAEWFDYYYDHPVLSAYVENGGVPANPIFDHFYPSAGSGWSGQADFTLPMVNTEGQELNPAKLYYNVYHDDEVFTFTPDRYSALSEEITDIPYSLSNVDFYVNGEKHTIYFYENDFEKFGVQLCYKRGDVVTKSDIVYHDGTIVEYENPKVLPGKETIIAEQPEGTLYENLYRRSVGYSSWSVSQNDGELGKMVIDDSGNFYIYSPVSGVDAWIKGEQTEEGTVVVKLPQAVSETTDYEGNPQVNYVWSMKSDVGGYVPDTDNPDITFTWSDNTLTMTGTNVFGLGDAEGNYQMGEGSLMLKVLPYAPLTEIPAGATTSEWKMDYDGQVSGNPSSIVVTVAMDGSDIYVKGLGGLPEAWVKGTFDGTTAVFASDQYLGIDEDKKGHSYFTGGRKEITTDPIGGYNVTDFYRTKDVKFTFDATSNTFRTDSVVLVGVGVNTNHFNYYYDHPVLSAYVENGGTPANPSFSSFSAYNSSCGYGETEFTLPMVNTEGQELNPAKLYYNVYHDGNVFTFSPDHYDYLYNEMTDIPYTFTNGFDFIVNGEKHTIYFYESDFEKFGVQLCYKSGDTVTKSDIVYHDGSTVGGAVSTSNMAERTVVGTIYTDILGRRVSQPVEGTFYLRTDLYDDGSRSTVKVRYCE